MVATVDIQEAMGSTPTWYAVTSARYCTYDNYNPGTNNPCVVPTTGYNYSYWKHHALYMYGSFTQINNIRAYTDGTIAWTLGTGGMLGVGRRDTSYHGCPANQYYPSVGTVGTTGTYLKTASTGHLWYQGQTVTMGDFASYTSAAPLTVDDTTYTSSARANSLVTQVMVASDATQGTKAAETVTFVYDEI
jgi:hypothetical protein